ncbi:hypothetical protein AVEN_236519-1 [Araneus ventricosus]|uniref:Uncharacterized protein n=1 Tax=Araneus ventricosus TaxID=182803 RepID=A0A4Y2TTK9_ARAVE|nr:hypothetical protein AVEN_236519-1 [Araneus ventricosus]
MAAFRSDSSQAANNSIYQRNRNIEVLEEMRIDQGGRLTTVDVRERCDPKPQNPVLAIRRELQAAGRNGKKQSKPMISTKKNRKGAYGMDEVACTGPRKSGKMSVYVVMIANTCRLIRMGYSGFPPSPKAIVSAQAC